MKKFLYLVLLISNLAFCSVGKSIDRSHDYSLSARKCQSGGLADLQSAVEGINVKGASLTIYLRPGRYGWVLRLKGHGFNSGVEIPVGKDTRQAVRKICLVNQ